MLGAGIAGLLAARVLADAFEQVTVIERDSLPGKPVPRSGIAQGKHIHSLWEGGRATLEDLFPRFTQRLLDDGAVSTELPTDAVFSTNGDFLAAGAHEHEMIFATRPLLS